MSAGLSPEDQTLAGEYVLGSLDATEALALRRRERDDPAFAAAVRAWEHRLAVILDDGSRESPPRTLWPAIEAEVDALTAARPVAVRLRRRQPVLALAATVLLALSLLLNGRLLLETAPAPASAPPAKLMAMLVGPDKEPAMVLVVDGSASDLAVRPLRELSTDDGDLQLWQVPASGAAPRPVGLLSASRAVTLPADALSERPAENATFAVSLEPRGGSPTGAPTGPVLFTGQLLVLPSTTQAAASP